MMRCHIVYRFGQFLSCGRRATVYLNDGSSIDIADFITGRLLIRRCRTCVDNIDTIRLKGKLRVRYAHTYKHPNYSQLGVQGTRQGQKELVIWTGTPFKLDSWLYDLMWRSVNLKLPVGWEWLCCQTVSEFELYFSRRWTARYGYPSARYCWGRRQD